MGHHPQDRRPGRLSAPERGAPAHGRDTIAAIATASGAAGIGVVRVSGPLVPLIARALLGTLPSPRHATVRSFRDEHGEDIDRGIALLFPAPGSYTGEDVLEIQAHGSAPVLQMLLERVFSLGARPARPGEFTERAFLEGRLDLVQAEAVADLVAAGSRQAARAARATLTGEFSRRVHDLVTRLTAARVRLEASLDFADEDVAEVDEAAFDLDLRVLTDTLAGTLDEARRGTRLRDGLRAVLVGAPNVGKSSIMNRLAGEERVIVTPRPGTTRDVIRESVRIGDAVVELADTAGLRESVDEIEQAGMRRARELAATADLLLVIEDDACPARLEVEGIAPGARMVTVYNKIDLSGTPPGRNGSWIRVSALTGAGFEELSALIAACAAEHVGEGAFSARRRHVQALEEAADALHAARSLHTGAAGTELVAEELRRAQIALGRITGAVSSDDLLGEIFSTFCIGK